MSSLMPLPELLTVCSGSAFVWGTQGVLGRWSGASWHENRVCSSLCRCEAQSLGWQQYLCTVVYQGEFVHHSIAL